MNTKNLWTLAAAASLALALPADDEVKALPDGPGKELVAKVCIDCHTSGTFRKSSRNDRWNRLLLQSHKCGFNACPNQ